MNFKNASKKTTNSSKSASSIFLSFSSFLLTRADTAILISYNTYSGVARIICEITSGEGVSIAATIKMIMTAYRRPVRIILGVRMPTLVRKKETTGISNTIPTGRVNIII